MKFKKRFSLHVVSELFHSANRVVFVVFHRMDKSV